MGSPVTLSDLCTLPVKKDCRDLKETCTAASCIQISLPNDILPQAGCCHGDTVYVLTSYCTSKVPFLELEELFCFITAYFHLDRNKTLYVLTIFCKQTRKQP